MSSPSIFSQKHSSTAASSASASTPEDAEDHEIFDINDFTTASDWERFIVQIEELINEWKLNSSNNDTLGESSNSSLFDTNFENGEWKVKEESIQFADEVAFTLSFYSLTSKSNLEHTLTSSSSSTSIKTPANDNEPVTSNPSPKIESDFESVYLSAGSRRDDILADVSEQTTSQRLVNLPPKSMADLLNKTNDFQAVSSNQSPTPSIAYWFGLCRFVLLTPTRSNCFIDSESRAKVVLSSISVAINNTGSSIPMFVQVNSPQRDMYVGLCEGSALKTYFQIVHFHYMPVQYAFLPGLMEIYKSKLGTHLTNSSLLVSVSMRFTYLIQESALLDWQSFSRAALEPKSFQEVELIDDPKNLDPTSIYPDVTSLSLGSRNDCIESIYLSCVWSNLSEDIVVDTEAFTDLNPQQSNDWSVTVFNTFLDKCELQLTDTLVKFGEGLKRTITVNQLLGNQSLTASVSNSSIASDDEQLRRTAATLDKLALNSSSTGSRRLDRVVNMSSNIVEKATNRIRILNPIDDPTSLPLDKGFLDFIMDHLFPDANLVRSKISDFTPRQETRGWKKAPASSDPATSSFLKRLNLMKASSVDNSGLLNKLATCLVLVNQIGQTRALAQLWREFVLELRFRYDSSVPISGLLSSADVLESSSNAPPPDLARCLLHQKVQMLNCCIRKRLDRRAYELSSGGVKKAPEDDSEEEFFDCEDSDADAPLPPPDGRLKKFSNLTLLNRPSEPIFIPITQESTPMTEDMLEQHASVLVNLGSSDDAALLRAKIQSASLLSDMQSFKAANPGCVLEDFVRWYSPRDWIEIEEKSVDPATNEEIIVKKCELSHRMKIPGNMWLEVWETARPVPVRKQKRLFDDTKEAENIFDWLNSLSVGQIVECILPVLYYSAIYSCFQEANRLELNSLTDPYFDVLVEKAIKISRNNDIKRYHELNNHLKTIEQILSMAQSLNRKFLCKKMKLSPESEAELKSFLRSLIKSSLGHESCEVKIPNGAHSTIGKLITKMCAQAAQEQISQAQAESNNSARSQSYEYRSLKEESQASRLVGDDDDEEESDEAEVRKNDGDRLLPLEKPFKREYILRSSVSRPAPYSRQSPQRLYCLMSNIEFRLAGAFTEDTMFF